MRSNPTNATVVCQALDVLCKLVKDDEIHRRLVEAGACEAMVVAMQQPGMEWQALQALCELAEDEDIRQRLVDAGASETVMAALRYHSMDRQA